MRKREIQLKIHLKFIQHMRLSDFSRSKKEWHEGDEKLSSGFSGKVLRT